MTIIVFNKPLNEINEDKCHYPLFSIHTHAVVDISKDFVEVLGRSVDRWNGLKVGIEDIAAVYNVTLSGAVAMLENCYPKSNNTCS